MGNILYAAEQVLPILLLLLIGGWLSHAGIVTEKFSSDGDRLCMKLLFPAMLFRSIILGGGQGGGYMRSIAFGYTVTVIAMLGGLLLIPKLVSDNKKRPVVIQSLYRGNFTLYGIAFSKLLGGDEGAAIASVMAAATLPLLNSAGVAMFAYFSDEGEHDIIKSLLSVIKHPIILAIILALGFNSLGVAPSGPLWTVVEDLAGLASPLAFILLGTKLNPGMFKCSRFEIGIICFKLIALPAIFLPLAVLVFNIRGVELIPAMLYVAAPSAITNYQLAAQYKADDVLAAKLVMLTTLASTVSICVMVSLLMEMGLI